MPLAWGIGRLAAAAAKSLGATDEEAGLTQMATSAALSGIDPVGGAIGIAHGAARVGRANGSTTAKHIEQGLSIAGLGDALGDIPDSSSNRT